MTANKRNIIKLVVIISAFLIIFTSLLYSKLTRAKAEQTTKTTCIFSINDSFVDNQLFVTLTPESSQYIGIKQEILNLIKSIDATVVEDFSALPEECVNINGSLNPKTCGYLYDYYKKNPFKQMLLIQFNSHSKQNVLDNQTLLSKNTFVHCVSPNLHSKYNSTANTEYSCSVNDEKFFEQWTLSSSANGGINATSAWGVTKGSKDIRVGIMDTGIALHHSDLESSIDRNMGGNYIKWEGKPGQYGPGPETYPTYLNKLTVHGTQVAGIIGAVSNNEMGISGICPNIKLVSLKIDNGTGQAVSNQNEVYLRAIYHARDSWRTDTPIDILNLSWAGYGINTSILEAIKSFPGLFVWCAGNDGKNVDNFDNIHYFDLPNLISVGARDRVMERSIWGEKSSSNYGNYVHIFAPGGKTSVNNSTHNILSTYVDENNNKTYYSNGGTSFAAPHVAGVAALMLSVNPYLTAAELKNILINSADTITISTPDGSQRVKNLNALAAVEKASIFNVKPVSDTEVEITGVNPEQTSAFYKAIDHELKHADKTITAIGNRAFAGMNITSVILPKTVKKIGIHAFKDCTSLTKLDMPDKVETLGYGIFEGCVKLQDVSLSPLITRIPDSAFEGCTSLASYANNVTTDVGKNSFRNCTALKTIDIPRIRNIGEHAFDGCSALTDLDLDNDLDSVGAGAFCGCTALASVSIGGNILSAGNGIFKDCTNLNTCNIDNLLKISPNTFENCSALSDVTLNPDLTEICDYAFYGCTGLDYINLPTALKTIGKRAFENCTGLTTIEIPSDVIRIGLDAFNNCGNINSVYYNAANCTIFGDAFYGIGKNTENLSVYIGSDVINIPENIFRGYDNLNLLSVNGNNNIYKSAGNCVIRKKDNCVILGCNYSTVPSYISAFGNYAFSGCSAIKAIEIPSGTAYIGDYAFNGCKSVNEFTLPFGLAEIGSHAFDDCLSLKRIAIPSTVTKIASHAFYNCSALTYADINSDIALIDTDYMFYGCSALISVYIPDTAFKIGDYMFYDCAALANVVIKETSHIESVGYYAFNNCAITTLDLPKTLESIDDYAFNDCDKLEYIFIDKSEGDPIAYISDTAFDGCPVKVIFLSDYATVQDHMDANVKYADLFKRSDYGLIALTDYDTDEYCMTVFDHYIRRSYNLNKITSDNIAEMLYEREPSGIICSFSDLHYDLTAYSWLLDDYPSYIYAENMDFIEYIMDCNMSYSSIPVLTRDEYSLGYNIAMQYRTAVELSGELSQLHNYADNYGFIPIVADEAFKSNLLFLTGMTQALDLPVKIFGYGDADELYDVYEYTNELCIITSSIDFLKWLNENYSINKCHIFSYYEDVLTEAYSTISYDFTPYLLSDIDNVLYAAISDGNCYDLMPNDMNNINIDLITELRDRYGSMLGYTFEEHWYSVELPDYLECYQSIYDVDTYRFCPIEQQATLLDGGFWNTP